MHIRNYIGWTEINLQKKQIGGIGLRFGGIVVRTQADILLDVCSFMQSIRSFHGSPGNLPHA